MFLRIKNRVEKELASYINKLAHSYPSQKISRVLFNYINEFISRSGKRIRPILFTVSFLGFSEKEVPGLYRSALSLELLHDFMLVHDDIIDKSETRRAKPSMHAMLNKYLFKYKNIKFNGQDLAIVAGDVMYAMAIAAFLSVKADPKQKEKALKLLINAALQTGSGEFIELVAGTKPIEEITKNEIYKIYDLKTACYTFATPLAMGAELAKARPRQVKLLFDYGMYAGRAFQIKDDILGIFGDEKEIGKSTLTDLQEAKKTILIWYAYVHSQSEDKLTIKKILSKDKVSKVDLAIIREIIIRSGALKYAQGEIMRLLEKVRQLNLSSYMRQVYKKELFSYFQQLLKIPA